MVDIFLTWYVFGGFWWLMTCFQWRWVHGCEPGEEASTCVAGHGLNCDPCPGKSGIVKNTFSLILSFCFFIPTCMSMPVPSPMNRFWKYLQGDLHIVKFEMQVRCTCSVCHQHNISSQYLSHCSTDKYETKITCHGLLYFFLLLVFLCWDQTRIYLHIAFFFGQGKSARHWTNSLSHSQSWGQKYRQDCKKYRNTKTQKIH